MLAKLFKKQTGKSPAHPALTRLKQMGVRSALCTLVQRADGTEVREEIGPVVFFGRSGSPFVRGGSLFLVPPSTRASELPPFSGRGEVLQLKFQHKGSPYTMGCRVSQRVRFSERLRSILEPQAATGYKLSPLGDMTKNESRGTLRFAHIRGVAGPQVFPHFRFDLYVELAQLGGLAHETPPVTIPFPGDIRVPESIQADATDEGRSEFFLSILRTNPDPLQYVHLSRLLRDPRAGSTELEDLGYTRVLGLRGEHQAGQIHVRVPTAADRKGPNRLKEGDVLLVRAIERSLLNGGDAHYRWACRVSKCGLETVTLSPKSLIQRQTGLAAMVRDFCVSGVGIQNSPILETYLLNTDQPADDPDVLKSQLLGKHLLLHFYPRLYFPKEVVGYRPRVPACFTILGEIVRAHVDTGKDEGRIASLGIAFRHDPADMDPQSFDVTAWEPLRGLRENPHFKEIHRALNSLLAFLD